MGEALRVVMGALTSAGIGMPEPTYRLNLTGGALPVVDLPDSESRPEALVMSEADPAPPPEPLRAEEVAPDRTIERMVEDERRTEGDADLLSPAAPRE